MSRSNTGQAQGADSMQSFARFMLLVTLLVGGVLLASCQGDTSSSDIEWLPLYGDGMSDSSPVIARIEDVEITQHQLDLYFDELTLSVRRSSNDDERGVICSAVRIIG